MTLPHQIARLCSAQVGPETKFLVDLVSTSFQLIVQNFQKNQNDPTLTKNMQECALC